MPGPAASREIVRPEQKRPGAGVRRALSCGVVPRPQGEPLRLSLSRYAARPSAFAASCADGRAATRSMNDLIAGHFAKSIAKYSAQFSTV